MDEPRTFLLYDSRENPSSWNERMVAGEYAILYSNLHGFSEGSKPICSVVTNLPAALVFAKQQVVDHPSLQCRIYDHHGLGREPVEVVQGDKYKGERGITPGFRRWVGSILLFGGIGLTIVDWLKDFRLTWPATLGMRMAPIGLVLLVTEVAVLLTARQKRLSKQVKP